MPRHKPITKGSQRCPHCQTIKPATDFYTVLKRGKLGLFRLCKLCSHNRTIQARARMSKEDRVKYDKKNHLSVYGLTPEKFSSMLKDQDNKCAICWREAKLYVDHNHISGVVRGLLCHHCNFGIGHFRDNALALERAAEYLLRHIRPSKKSA